MPTLKPRVTLLTIAALLSLAACNTVQGVKQDAHVVKEKAVEVKDAVVEKAIEVKDKTVEGTKAVGQSVGSGLEKAGEAVKGATN
jgi:predicted small secreted protein